MELRVGNLSDFWEIAVEALDFEVLEVWGFVFNHLNSNQIIRTSFNPIVESIHHIIKRCRIAYFILSPIYTQQLASPANYVNFEHIKLLERLNEIKTEDSKRIQNTRKLFLMPIFLDLYWMAPLRILFKYQSS